MGLQHGTRLHHPARDGGSRHDHHPQEIAAGDEEVMLAVDIIDDPQVIVEGDEEWMEGDEEVQLAVDIVAVYSLSSTSFFAK
eukprot:m.155159 g.155159  ORF g.155159 m.155159 type:complete len:82 (-) comp30927_c0_seq1:98-343(-)